MKNNILFIFLALTVNLYSQITVQEYIHTYSPLAISEMQSTGIPASITLAQGILESANGNSMLAREANNHFGIKCHKSWDGKKIYKDDDRKHECFRKYKTVKESYDDHSNFLVKYSRYSFLFELKPTDYKAWAKGLKKAGYATNPKYPKRLIKIIEENELYKYDNFSKLEQKDLVAEYKDAKNNNESPKETSNYIIKKRPKPVEDYEFQIGYEIKLNNKVKYIVAKKGDTFDKLTKKMEKMFWELPKYNELDKNAKLEQGQIIYIQPKRRNAEKGKDYHIAKKGETLYTISQIYAVKMKHLIKKNNFTKDQKIHVGDKIWLRNIKK